MQYGCIASECIEYGLARADSSASVKGESREVEGSGRAMPILTAQVDACPNADEIRAALGHMAASEAFRGSPQLVAFLRYVVETTLRGEQDRIKGYTIAIEALGRGDDFNPQDDPIVRVEAMRLRRALQRYYANGGRDDSVRIELPVGTMCRCFATLLIRLHRCGRRACATKERPSA